MYWDYLNSQSLIRILLYFQIIKHLNILKLIYLHLKMGS